MSPVHTGGHEPPGLQTILKLPRLNELCPHSHSEKQYDEESISAVKRDPTKPSG
jgi:hypothetical protein